MISNGTFRRLHHGSKSSKYFTIAHKMVLSKDLCIWWISTKCSLSCATASKTIGQVAPSIANQRTYQNHIGFRKQLSLTIIDYHHLLGEFNTIVLLAWCCNPQSNQTRDWWVYPSRIPRPWYSISFSSSWVRSWQARDSLSFILRPTCLGEYSHLWYWAVLNLSSLIRYQV